MEQAIREKYSNEIFEEAARKFGLAKEGGRLLDGFESYIYEYDKNGRSYILRISHSLRRTADAIRGELDWINYLADHGVSVCRAIPSQNSNLVEVIPVDGTYFIASSFEKAPGGFVGEDERKPELFGAIGRMIGRMHALAKEYQPGKPEWKRHSWNEEVEGSAEKFLPASDQIVIAKFNDLLKYLHTLPRDHDSYGLIHIDFHEGNFFIDDGNIHLFDFDDCQYCWFVADIAIALFYAIPHHCESEEGRKVARRFFDTFMEGYSRENSIDPSWLRQIPHFLKLREIDLYIIIHRSFHLDEIDPWCTSYMKNRKQKIENDVPFVDIDFG
jgi:amicoumacin kinase